jgi:hypothetical protein
MEVEWMGCEFIHEDGKFLRIDQIRLAKTINVKSFKANNVVGVYKGWVTEEIIPFKSGSDDDIKRTKLTERSKHKFNIQELFAARGIEEKEEQHSVEPQDLH